LFRLDASSKKLEERMRQLEAAVFKVDKENTLFEVYEEKLIKMDVHLKAEQGRFSELFNTKFRSIEEELFTYKNRIAECTLLKSQFDIFLEKQQ
jgi:signal recognition particle GTPase